MIIAVNLNPCIDKAIGVESLDKGEVNRVQYVTETAAGKGITFSTMAHTLNGNAKCIGFNYKKNGAFIEEDLNERMLPHEFIMVDGTVRTNLKIVETSTHVTTEVNEKGGLISEKQFNEMKKRVFEYAKTSEIISFNGSVPQGVPKTVYRDWMIELREQFPNIKLVVDAEEELLKYALEAKPNLIKPNVYEIETTFGIPIKNREDALKAIDKLLEVGIECVCLSMGGDGAIIANKAEKWFAPPLKVEVKGTTGAGDSMLAGICVGIQQGMTLKDQLKLGAATATSTVMHPSSELGTKEEIDTLLERITIEKIG